MKYGDRKSYPEVYFSKEVEAIMKKKAPLPEPPIEPVKPKRPMEPATGNPFWAIAIIAASVFLVTFAVFDDPPGILVVISVLSCIAFLISLFMAPDRGEKNTAAKKQYEFDLWKYQDSLKRYDEDCNRYAKAKVNYESQVVAMTSDQALRNYRKTEMKRYLGRRTKPIYESYSGNVVKKGKAEDDFALLLDFSFNVLGKKRVPVGETYYYPDILIECDNIYVDIEIDEPYSEEDGEPIHYLETGSLSVDFLRNCYMNDMGFEVIRFSEEQICVYTNECLVFVKSVIDAIKNGEAEYDCPQGLSMPKWDRDQARRLSKKQYRQTYFKGIQDRFSSSSLVNNASTEGWIPVGLAKKLTEVEKNSIKSAVIRHHNIMINGEKRHLVSLAILYNNGNTKAYRLSKANEQFPTGTQIDINSIALQTVMDLEGNIHKHAYCKVL